MKKDFPFLAMLTGFLFSTACSQAVKFDLPPTQENFGQNVTYNNKVDILWIVDNSSSMLKHQQSLSAQVPDLVTKLNSLKMDYHMAVVTTSMGGSSPDGGKFLGSPKYLTSQNSDLVAQLTSRIQAGEGGSNLERGLESMETALSASYLSNEGKGFFRNDALLVVIALSDEDDFSKSNSAEGISYYTNFLDKVKAPWVDGSRSWVFNFIGVLSLTSKCKTFNDFASPGLSYTGLVDVSAGIKESICNTSLSTAVSNIRARIYQILTDFKLSKLPAIESLVVSINGVEVPRNNTNGWDYIEAENLIRFYGSFVPAADASIKVDFKPRDAN